MNFHKNTAIKWIPENANTQYGYLTSFTWFHTHKNTNYSTQIKCNSIKILINLQKLQGDPFYPIKIQNISRLPNSLLKIYSETNFAIFSLQYHYSSLQIQLSKSLSGHWKNDPCLSNSLPSSPEGRLKKYVCHNKNGSIRRIVADAIQNDSWKLWGKQC